MQILRLLDNETIEAEDISEAKEMVDDYMSRNQEDFDDFSAPDDLYADLLDQLDNLEVSSAFLTLLLASTVTWKRHGRCKKTISYQINASRSSSGALQGDRLHAARVLDVLQAQQPVAVNHIGKGVGSKDKDNKEREKEREKERNAALAMKMQLAQGGLQ